ATFPSLRARQGRCDGMGSPASCWLNQQVASPIQFAVQGPSPARPAFALLFAVKWGGCASRPGSSRSLLVSAVNRDCLIGAVSPRLMTLALSCQKMSSYWLDDSPTHVGPITIGAGR